MRHILALWIITISLSACNEDKINLATQSASLEKRSVAKEYRIDNEIGKYVKCYSRLAGKTQKVYELETGQVLKLVPGSAIVEHERDVWLHVSPKGYTNTCYVKTAFLEPVAIY